MNKGSNILPRPGIYVSHPKTLLVDHNTKVNEEQMLDIVKDIKKELLEINEKIDKLNNKVSKLPLLC